MSIGASIKFTAFVPKINRKRASKLRTFQQLASVWPKMKQITCITPQYIHESGHIEKPGLEHRNYKERSQTVYICLTSCWILRSHDCSSVVFQSFVLFNDASNLTTTSLKAHTHTSSNRSQLLKRTFWNQKYITCFYA